MVLREEMIKFIDNVIMLCLKFNLSVTSWFRTDKRNKMVGGVDNSLHRFCLAIDVVPDDWGVMNELKMIATQLGIEVIDEKDHIHLEKNIKRERRA